MRTPARSLLITVAVAAALTGCADQDDPDTPAGGAQPTAAATADDDTDDGPDGGTEVALRDAAGTQVGTASFEEEAGGLEVEVEVADLTPGFHGLHVHAVGLCEPGSPDPQDPAKVGDFLSAGGHQGADAADHGAHAGDLPPLLVGADGTGRLTAWTDAVTLADLQDDDGAALMVHAGPDNLAHVPERYAPAGPDETTRKTGDAGDRVACGAVEAAGS